MKIEQFEEIEAWKEARKLVKSVYGVCSVNEFKKDCTTQAADKIQRQLSNFIKYLHSTLERT